MIDNNIALPTTGRYMQLPSGQMIDPNSEVKLRLAGLPA